MTGRGEQERVIKLRAPLINFLSEKLQSNLRNTSTIAFHHFPSPSIALSKKKKFGLVSRRCRCRCRWWWRRRPQNFWRKFEAGWTNPSKDIFIYLFADWSEALREPSQVLPWTVTPRLATSHLEFSSTNSKKILSTAWNGNSLSGIGC